MSPEDGKRRAGTGVPDAEVPVFGGANQQRVIRADGQVCDDAGVAAEGEE